MKDDIDHFRDCLKKFKVQEWEELKLSLNPKEDEVTKVIEKLKSMLEEGKSQTPPINYLVMFLFAGHGMIKEGAQVLLYNEFDKKSGFYKMFKAEEIIRNMAAEFDNSYLMGIFACCR